MTALKTFVDAELASYRRHRTMSRVDEAWAALERAHILSQPDAWLHTRVHWEMLSFAVALSNWDEVRGQIARIGVAAVGSWLGRAPIGNTGRSNVPILQPMAVPPDLAAKLAAVRESAESSSRMAPCQQTRTPMFLSMRLLAIVALIAAFFLSPGLRPRAGRAA